MTSAPKRTTQWVGAVLILAAMVFGLAFAMNYLDQGPSRRPVAKGPAGPRLEFKAPVYPLPGQPPLVCEHQQQGFHDFWFSNPSDKDLTFGLRSVSSEDSRGKSSNVNGKGLRVELYRVPGMSPADVPPKEDKQEAAARELAAKLEALPLTPEEPRTVPGKASGWLRLHWDGQQLHWDADRPEPRPLKVVLWMDHPQDDMPAQLAVQVIVVRPLLVQKDVPLGTLEVRSLPRSWPMYCFSATRPELRLEAEVEHRGRPKSADPLEVASVERLSDAECRKWEQAEPKRGSSLPLRCGYRVTVKLRDVSPDGTTPLELGPFRRTVRLTCAGTDVAERVVLTGLVVGDVTVGGPNAGGVVDVGQGATAKVSLQSDVPGLELEVDAARTPECLEVKLEKPEVAPSGHRTWRLVVKVRPGTVSGPLPGDCAVYIKRKGEGGRTIRVPVVGTANSG
jgi:hypothetical protein